MYDKKIKDDFWVAFGKYMSLSTPASGEKINWINYKTKVKHIRFKLTADDMQASLEIELSDPDLDKQQKLFHQLTEDLPLLIAYTDANWQRQLHFNSPDGRIVSVVYQHKNGVNVYRKSDWPDIISFLKPLLVGLDKFWFEQDDIYTFIGGG